MRLDDCINSLPKVSVLQMRLCELDRKFRAEVEHLHSSTHFPIGPRIHDDSVESRREMDRYEESVADIRADLEQREADFRRRYEQERQELERQIAEAQ